VFITTFTPGPNNVSSASMGVLYGYRRALPYLAGIAAGFVGVMLLCGGVSTLLLGAFPSIERVLRWIGAAYIPWLAYHTLRASYGFESDDGQASTPMGFGRGLLLQALNPKMIVYGLALYSGFLAPVLGSPWLRVGSAIFLASVAFVAVSFWALFGSAIKAFLRRPRARLAVNWVLAFFLVCTAIELSGVLALLAA
jgi:cysteine/O-acetylserine efflux protein